jgi:hypothetical protein
LILGVALGSVSLLREGGNALFQKSVRGTEFVIVVTAKDFEPFR